MGTKTRKQREFDARHQLILDTARVLLKVHSPRQITISMIADRVEYSKGTIYQHFGCKEEIFHALAVECAGCLLELVQRAGQHSGPTREIITLAVEAYYVYSMLYKLELVHMPVIRSPAFQDKVPVDQQEMLVQLEIAVMAEIVTVINTGVKKGELILPSYLQPAEVAAGCWSMLYGSYTLLSSWDTRHLGLGNITDIVRKGIQVYLDGLSWHPLTSEWDPQSIVALAKSVFASEFELISAQ